MLVALFAVAWAQPAVEDVPLDQLLDLFDDHVDQATSVADRVSRSAREATGLVTVLTGDELRRLGARDLMDALRLLPSIQFAGDVWNTDALLMRGAMGGDGRVLLLVDGHELNENLYGVIPLANRIPVTLIDRIEVIRGPGSAIYGGYAMFGVIRVTTKAQTLEGGEATARASWLSTGDYGRQDVTVSGGAAVGEDGHIGVSAVVGRGRRSAETYTDVFGGETPMVDGSALNPMLVTTDFTLGGLSSSLAAESYRISWVDGSARRVFNAHENWFSGVYGRVAYAIPVGTGHLRLYGSSKWQRPWRSVSWPVASYNYFRDDTDRTVAGVDALAPLGDRVDAQGGVEAGVDRGRTAPEDLPEVATQFMNVAGWAQLAVQTDPANLTAGVRVDTNTAFGSAVSPRLVMGQAWRGFHYKTAVNRAFRAPSIYHARSQVDPEVSTCLEAEVGVGPTAWSYVTGSVYRNQLSDAMVYRYTYDPVSGEESDGYINGTGLTSVGGEADVQVLTGPWNLSVGWAGVSVRNAQEDWAVPGGPERVLAVPAHRGVGRLSYDAGDRLTLGTVLTVVGSRFAITRVEGGEDVYEALPAAGILDVAAELRHVGIRGLSIGVNVHDLFDANPSLPQGYWARHAPLPGPGREILIQVGVAR